LLDQKARPCGVSLDRPARGLIRLYRPLSGISMHNDQRRIALLLECFSHSCNSTVSFNVYIGTVLSFHLPYTSFGGFMRALRITAMVVFATSSMLGFQGKYKAAENITAGQLRDYLSFIASDEMEGRNTPSRGLNTAAKFLATHLSRWGYKPAGDNGSYFQRILLRNSKVDPSRTTAKIGDQEFTFGKDYYTLAMPGTASGKLVFAGFGYRIPARNINPYEGLDVKGKIIVKMAGMPKGTSFNDLNGKMGVDWDGATSYGSKNGAVGVILVPDFRTLSSWNQNVDFSTNSGQWEVEEFITKDAPSLPTLYLSARMANVLFQGEAMTAEAIFRTTYTRDSIASFNFKDDKTVTFTASVRTQTDWTQNVVGMLEGSDSDLKKEYVAIGAHYDHVGTGSPVKGDSIYNGADDDGSGTVTILAMAESFAKGPRPKRSVLFVWHAGEERGLWGSKYFVEHPTVPLKNIVTQLNIDMVGRSKKDGDEDPRNKELSGPNEIYVIGSEMMSSELGLMSKKVNSSFLDLAFNYTYDDPKDPNRFFFRSDHYNYAQKGIPIIFYFDGVHEDYHQLGDEWQKIDYVKMEKVARTVYATAWELSNTPKRPKVDKELPKELKER
jgi:hypothetical protein